jgi:hypothetical protein
MKTAWKGPHEMSAVRCRKALVASPAMPTPEPKVSGVGRLTGDAHARAEGFANQAAGTAQDLYGQAADTARQTATTLDGWLRHNIETQPYTSALIAFGIGWLLGRMHRPLYAMMRALA